MIKKKEFNNEYSLILGVLCLLVVYLHSSWARGFEIDSFGIDSMLLKQFLSMLLLTVVPSFFIIWGILSEKYFFDNESSKYFFLRKIKQFYPIFLFSFFLNFAYKPIPDVPIWKIVLGAIGLYYQKGFYGGNIYVPVFAVIITVSLLKLNKNKIFLKLLFFTVFCLILTKVFVNENDFYIIKYFGYYTAFFLGATLSHLKLCVLPWQQFGLYRYILIVIFCLAYTTPLLNLYGWKYLEIQYGPNSFEQLFLCFTLIIFGKQLATQIIYRFSDFFFVKFLHNIGNNAYFHFITQAHIIFFLIFLGEILKMNPILNQLFIITTTSYFSIYLLKRIYDYFLLQYVSFIKICRDGKGSRG